MITSIFRILRHSRSGTTNTTVASDQGQGLTRSDFLRVMAAGALVAGTSVATGQAFAAASKKHSKGAPVTDVDKIYDAWQSRLNSGDLDALVDLYLPDVVYINPEGKKMIGQDKVREDLGALIALKPSIDIHDRHHIVYRDIVFTTNHSRLKITNPDGTTQEMNGSGLEILQKQADGGWRYIIDDASRGVA